MSQLSASALAERQPGQAAPGTWRVTGVPHGRALPMVRIVSDACEGIIAECQVGTYAAADPEANARRIVACVNACAGIPTEQLEAAISIAAHRRQASS